ncbi:dTDP-4-dehydrorhamnose reductase [Rhodobacterales bacterium]|nr:dTDP-4-dehydrorhamnose reductase [Rhodobacterales bacterium]
MSAPLKILVAGRTGQLARALVRCAEEDDNLDLIASGRPELDITDPLSCRWAIDGVRPDIVINPAAFTNVDAATTNPDMAEAVNAKGAGYLAAAAAAKGIPIIHISTDYVFDGTKPDAYVEDDRVNPINTYGKTKLAGESAIGSLSPHHLILRTAWVYSIYEPNFVASVLKKASGPHPMAMVTDQIGNPTSAADLAGALLQIARKMTSGDWERLSGVYHLAGPEPMTRHAWAHAILSASRALSGPDCDVQEAVTADFPTPARRPLQTSLDSGRCSTLFDVTLPPADLSLRATVGSLLKTKETLA